MTDHHSYSEATPISDVIQQRLAALAPSSFDIQDDSALHAGHAGNGGGGHFTVKLVSSQFSGKSQIIRHRLIYQALADLIPHKIHALSIHALAPDEIPSVPNPRPETHAIHDQSRSEAANTLKALKP